MTEDEMVGWHQWLDGHEFEQALEGGDDREAWLDAVHGVTKSQTWLSNWTDWLKKLGFNPWLGGSSGGGHDNSLQDSRCILVWRIPLNKEPGGLQSIGLQRVGHNWSDLGWCSTNFTMHAMCLNHSKNRPLHPGLWKNVLLWSQYQREWGPLAYRRSRNRKESLLPFWVPETSKDCLFQGLGICQDSPLLTWKGRDIFQLGILPADPTTCSQYPWRDQRTSTTMKSNSWCWDEPHCPKRALITSVTRKSISERQNTPFYLSSIWITPPTKKFGSKWWDPLCCPGRVQVAPFTKKSAHRRDWTQRWAPEAV